MIDVHTRVEVIVSFRYTVLYESDDFFRHFVGLSKVQVRHNNGWKVSGATHEINNLYKIYDLHMHYIHMMFLLKVYKRRTEQL